MIFMIRNRFSCCCLFLLFIPVQMKPDPQLHNALKAALKSIEPYKNRLHAFRKKHSAFLFCCSLSQAQILFCRRILGRSPVHLIGTDLWCFLYHRINHIVLIILQTAHRTVCQKHRQLIISCNQAVILRISILPNLTHSGQISSRTYGTSG